LETNLNMKEVNYLVIYKCDSCGITREIPHLSAQKPNGKRKFVCQEYLQMNKKDLDKLTEVKNCEFRIEEVKNVG